MDVGLPKTGDEDRFETFLSAEKEPASEGFCGEVGRWCSKGELFGLCVINLGDAQCDEVETVGVGGGKYTGGWKNLGWLLSSPTDEPTAEAEEVIGGIASPFAYIKPEVDVFEVKGGRQEA